MIKTLRGTLMYKGVDPVSGEASVLLETGGVGFGCQLPARALAYLNELGAEQILYTQLIFKPDRPDGMMLVGFTSSAERELFMLLMGASGVGPKSALALLNALTVSQLVEAVVADAPKVLTAAKGVGLKAAQKIVLDLREKLKARQTLLMPGLTAEASDALNQSALAGLPSAVATEASSVLEALGYSASEVAQALRAVSQAVPVSGADDREAFSAEAVLRESLRWLARQA
ncbi:MAG: Holliday junction branch migration protein RuvA [Vampirovibrionales bacterium]|nr:Holliday junction branch migration protein RuvA [Vampirovibrionales bacterium]